MCNVIHIRDKKNTTDEVYIGRGSIWGNPYKIGRDGDRMDVIDKYEELMRQRMLNDKDLWIENLKKLDGKTLVCFCKPHDCHGDTLSYLVYVAKDKGEI
jgi:hypothetical protein